VSCPYVLGGGGAGTLGAVPVLGFRPLTGVCRRRRPRTLRRRRIFWGLPRWWPVLVSPSGGGNWGAAGGGAGTGAAGGGEAQAEASADRSADCPPLGGVPFAPLALPSVGGSQETHAIPRGRPHGLRRYAPICFGRTSYQRHKGEIAGFFWPLKASSLKSRGLSVPFPITVLSTEGGRNGPGLQNALSDPQRGVPPSRISPPS